MRVSKIIKNAVAPVIIGALVGSSVFGSGCTKRVPTELKNKILVEANACDKTADSITKEIKMGKVSDADVEKNISKKISKAREYVKKVRGANYEDIDTSSLRESINMAKGSIKSAEKDLEAMLRIDTAKKTGIKGIVQ